MKLETADTIRSRLENYKLGSTDDAAQYINNFLTSYRELNEIPGEALSESHAISMFLQGITDPDFETFVKIQRSKNESLMNAIVALRKEDRELLEKRANNRRFKNKLQRMREEIKDDLVERGRDPKRIQRKYDDVDTLKLTGHGCIQVLFQMWKDATKEDKDFVVAYNSKIRHCDDPSKLEPTSIFKDLLKEKG